MSDNGNEFDLNDPNLVIDVPEDYDPEAGMEGGGRPQPPSDGKHLVVIKLREGKENPIYFKNGAVLAACEVRVVKDDGMPGQYLKDWYPSTRVSKFQKTSSLAFIAKKLGQPLNAAQRHPNDIIKHLAGVFAAAGEEGIPVMVTTQWVKSTPDGNGGYVELKGQKLIAQAALAAAQHEAYEKGFDEDKTALMLAEAQANPHVYYDETGEERTVRAEVRFIVGA